MTPTATEAAPPVRQNRQHGQLAVRLSPMPPQSSMSPAPSPKPLPPPSPASLTAPQFPPSSIPDSNSTESEKPAVPKHPIPAMQEAFAESLAEVSSGLLSMKPNLRAESPQTRRDRLLDQEKSEGPPAAIWRLRPGQNCHELRKLLAQIAFGLYLLLKDMANNDIQVVAILQGHIDEVDDFLKTAMEDLNLATHDLNARLEYLKLPLGNLPAFEEMLEDREFRLRIVEGNVCIEHILSRTTTALQQTFQDITEGMRSTQEFTAYLSDEECGTWRHERPSEVADIFAAMQGNAEGWLNAFTDLLEKSNALNALISNLAEMVTEMDRCAGEVSRRTRFSIKPYSLPDVATGLPREPQGSLSPRFRVSHEATPPLSPGIVVPQKPPRLSLRFSTLGDVLEPNFLEIDIRSDGPGASAALPSTPQHTPPESSPNEVLGSGDSMACDPFTDPDEPSSDIRNSDEIEASDLSSGKADADADDSSITAVKNTIISRPLSEGSDLMPVPLRIVVNKDKASTPRLTADDGADPEAVGGLVEARSPPEATVDKQSLYILQPKIYSPQTSPLASPQVHEIAGQPSFDREHLQPPSRLEATSPRILLSPVDERLSYRGAASPLSSGPHGENAPLRLRPSTSGVSSSSQGWSDDRPVNMDPINSTLLKTTSIRDRVSLRTNPPDAILVPPRNAPQLQRPGFVSPRIFDSYPTSAGPDSVSSPTNDRTASVQFTDIPRIRSSHTAHGSLGSNGSYDHRDYPLPVYPNILPSPNSDLQYFRPVQASPHSPLQQRPHTAGPHVEGQAPSRPCHLRNAPSSMGMSMLSSATAMTQDSKGQPTLKKKRSAFGWIKKAFTLDEEERVTFDQRRQIQERNLYYDTRSPKFLDGKRVK
ncbi:hypothetical protein SEPCBS119000_000505 [Sporothrix epigloea]|uniref:Uncharacterized protein n=1 Tax=Sporothrix epigloea TaxID=1892477 RepID=A0ABP0D5U3_9PEZI